MRGFFFFDFFFQGTHTRTSRIILLYFFWLCFVCFSPQDCSSLAETKKAANKRWEAKKPAKTIFNLKIFAGIKILGCFYWDIRYHPIWLTTQQKGIWRRLMVEKNKRSYSSKLNANIWSRKSPLTCTPLKCSHFINNVELSGGYLVRIFSLFFIHKNCYKQSQWSCGQYKFMPVEFPNWELKNGS